jgi:hypothetical protein
VSRLVRETYFPFRDVQFEIIEDIVTLEQKEAYGFGVFGGDHEPEVHYHVALAPNGESFVLFTDEKAREVGEAMFSSHTPSELIDELRVECLAFGLAADDGTR